MKRPETRRIEIREQRPPPAASIVFAIAAMLPFPAGALLALAGGDHRQSFATATALWGAAVLSFLAGVRRGVSFRTPGGATAGQLGGMLALFLCALAALAILVLPLPMASGAAAGAAALLLAFGYAAVGALDVAGARAGTMPLHFVHLRPWQALVAVLSLLAVGLTTLLHP